uniref:hypothetical protein n=1 Tax=Cellulosimicrobium cellulans TaxID=1710 RepID=UPI001112DDE1
MGPADADGVSPTIEETPLAPVDQDPAGGLLESDSANGGAVGPQTSPAEPDEQAPGEQRDGDVWSATAPASGAVTVAGVTWAEGAGTDRFRVEVRSRTGATW